MPAVPTNRTCSGLIVATVIGLMGYALYTQYFEGLKPCPLCVTQRGFYLLAGLVALIAAIHNRRARIYGGLVTLAAIGGASVAGRQVWLQHLPADQVPACGPDLSYMLETFPLSEVLLTLFRGDGNCAEVVWQFLGLSMPEWSLIWFVILAAAGLWLVLRRRTA